MTTRAHPRAVALALLLALALVACGGGRRGHHDDGPPQPTPEAITKVTENGPVKATVKVWPPAPQLGDPLYLQLTIEAGAGVAVAAPFEDEGLGRFAAVGWTHDTVRRADGATVETQVYTLEPPGSGKHRIPPFRLLVTDGRGAAPSTPATAAPATAAPATATPATAAPATAAPTELLTEEIPIEVAPVDPARAAEPLAAARGRLPIVVGGWAWWQIALVVAAGLALVVGGVLAVRAMRHRAVIRTRVSAYEVARQRLDALARGGAPAPAALDGWFVELSAIVRHYVEDRFGLRAPELTTEEFMQIARKAPGLSGPHRELLSAFLERCDRVKFAGYRPDADESMATLQAARDFIDDTRLKEAA